MVLHKNLLKTTTSFDEAAAVDKATAKKIGPARVVNPSSFREQNKRERMIPTMRMEVLCA
eukprot:scaffold7480_cov62-Alexandrium_tamarense.AAC.1